MIRFSSISIMSRMFHKIFLRSMAVTVLKLFCRAIALGTIQPFRHFSIQLHTISNLLQAIIFTYIWIGWVRLFIMAISLRFLLAGKNKLIYVLKLLAGKYNNTCHVKICLIRFSIRTTEIFEREKKIEIVRIFYRTTVR